MFNAQYLLFANNVVVLPVALYNHNLISSSSRLSLSSGENQRLLKDLCTVFAHLATLKRQLTESAAPPAVSKAEMKTFLSSKVANYLFRLIIQMNNSPVSKRTNYSSSFQAFLDFYVLKKLYEFEFIAADESWLLRKMFRYQLAISAYLVIWKSILFVRLVRRGINNPHVGVSLIQHRTFDLGAPFDYSVYPNRNHLIAATSSPIQRALGLRHYLEFASGH